MSDNPPPPCQNTTCAQYRLQHRNMTMKTLELEKELEQIKRTQNATFNNAVAQNAVTHFRDAATGEMGLMMPNGEVMTREKILKKMEIAAKCMETSCAYEKLNRDLTQRLDFMKIGFDKAYNEQRRLEKLLAGFEKPRAFETFTEEHHKETLARNEELADEVETMEYEMHRLQEENALLVRRHQRMKKEMEALKEEIKKKDKPVKEKPQQPKIARKKKRAMLEEDDSDGWDQIAVTPPRTQSPEAEDVVDDDHSDGGF